MNKIIEFQGQWRFLSNFWPCPVQLDGTEYPSIENAYQASKTLDPKVRIIFTTCYPGQAKRAGRILQVRSDWEQVKLQIMEDLVRQKFQSPGPKQLLLGTRDAILEEGNYWNDRFWGISPVGSNNGLNHLGKILMKIRSELQ